MYCKPTPEAVAEAIAEAVAGAITEVVARVIVRVALKVTLRISDQGPPGGPNPRRRVTFQEPRDQAGSQRGGRELTTRAFHFRSQNMVRVASLPTKYPMLVVGTPGYSQHEGPTKACTQGLGLLPNSQSKE